MKDMQIHGKPTPVLPATPLYTLMQQVDNELFDPAWVSNSYLATLGTLFKVWIGARSYV